MTVAATSGKESSLDCSCMRTLSPTCKAFQANGVTAVSFCPSAQRGERVASPRRAVRHGGHSHHVACAAASRLASPGKDNRHRPQRRDGGGRSTSAVLSARIGPACAGAASSCRSDIAPHRPNSAIKATAPTKTTSNSANARCVRRRRALVSTSIMSLVPGHVEHIDVAQRRATVRHSHPMRPTLRYVATCSRTTSTRPCQRRRSSRERRFGVRASRLLLPALSRLAAISTRRAYVGNILLATNSRKYPARVAE